MDQPDVPNDDLTLRVDRREFLLSTLAIGAAAASPPRTLAATAQSIAPEPKRPPSKVTVRLRVNGTERELTVDTRTTLLDLLRERLGFTGAKKGCNYGQCGACTVLVNGRRVNSCLTLAVQNAGREVTTVEGLADGEKLSPLQEAFLEHDAFQCGFCTPGQLCSATALLREGKAGSAGEIRENMSGNLCRCGAYPNIVAAIEQARKRGGA
jgi:xanthine dehydrogenase YagT iron-sulfur-binding subunit